MLLVYYLSLYHYWLSIRDVIIYFIFISCRVWSPHVLFLMVNLSSKSSVK